MSEFLSAMLASFEPPEKVVASAIEKNKKRFSSLPMNGKHASHPIDLDTTLNEKATPEQVEAFELLKRNPEKMIAIIGPGGTGKSQFIHWIADKFKKIGRKVHVTATTGYAAYQLNGTTFYKFFSLFPSWYKYATKLESDPKMLNEAQFLKLANMYHTPRLRETSLKIIDADLLIIDEVSMLEGATLLVMDMIARYLRRRPDIPFGGMQVLLSGDFLQLPPVTSSTSSETKTVPRFIFQYYAWDDIWKPIVVHFKTNVRSLDPVWSSILSRMRVGKCTEDDIEKLKRRRVTQISRSGVGRLPPNAVLTHLFPHAKRVEDFNIKERNLLKTTDRFFNIVVEMQANVADEIDEFYFFTNGKKHNPDDYREKMRRIDSLEDDAYKLYFSVANNNAEMSTIPHDGFPFLASNDEKSSEQIEAFFQEYKLPVRSKFRVGEKVMLRDNVLQESGLVNGSTGVVVGFLKEEVNVEEFADKSTLTLESLQKKEWSEDGRGLPVVQWSHGETTLVPYSLKKVRLLKNKVDERKPDLSSSSSSSSAVNKKKKRQREESLTISWMMHFYYLPLQSAAAITSHKCQGLTLPYVFVGTPQFCFDFGMVYVMCSRVRKMEHLFLDDSFDAEHIKAHPDAVVFSEKSLSDA